jgi:hypothetical protein
MGGCARARGSGGFVGQTVKKLVGGVDSRAGTGSVRPSVKRGEIGAGTTVGGMYGCGGSADHHERL